MEKLKELLSKGWFYCGIVITFLSTYVWYLLTKNERMQHKVNLAEEKESQAKFRERLEQKEKEAKNAEEELRDTIAKYKSEHPDGTGD